MEKKTKEKIKGIVDAYIRLFPKEYEQVVTLVKDKRYNHRNEFAELQGEYALKRPLYEISETLDTMLNQQLSPEELQEFKDKDCKGARWFAKTFTQFSVPKTL